MRKLLFNLPHFELLLKLQTQLALIPPDNRPNNELFGCTGQVGHRPKSLQTFVSTTCSIPNAQNCACVDPME